jgi:tetratricopeptide (TPR) repeat protein
MIRRQRLSMAIGLALVALAILGLASCSSGEDKNFLERMFDLESRSMKNAPPSSVEELKAAISQYRAEVERTVSAMESQAGYWRLLAVRLMEQGLFGDSYEAALKALRYYPDNSGLYYVAGLSASFLSRSASAELGGGAASREAWLRAAEGAYLESIDLNPRNTRSLYALAVLYSFELEDYEAAVAMVQRFLAISTRDADGFLLLGRSLYGAGRLEEAVEAYDNAIRFTTIEEKKKQASDNKKQILDELYGS